MKVRFPILRFLNILLILLTFLCYLSPYVSPAQFWFMAFVGLLYPWLLLANVLFIAFWLLMRRAYFLFSVGCIALGWSHFTGLVGLHFANNTKADKQQTLSIVTFNAHSLKHFKHNQSAVDTTELSTIFKGEQPDVVCFQEFTGYGHLMFVYPKYVKNRHRLPYELYHTTYNLAIFSKYPMGKTHLKSFNGVNGYQYADITVKGKIFRIFNVHLQSNSVSGIADRMVAAERLKEEEALRDVRTMARRFKRAAQKRARQSAEVAAEIAKSPHPVIVCGDFNDIPQSYAYHLLSKGLQDAFKEKGVGIGVTYAGKIPGLRIDYILTSPTFKVLKYEKRRTSFSDHYAVASTVALPIQ